MNLYEEVQVRETFILLWKKVNVFLKSNWQMNMKSMREQSKETLMILEHIIQNHF